MQSNYWELEAEGIAVEAVVEAVAAVAEAPVVEPLTGALCGVKTTSAETGTAATVFQVKWPGSALATGAWAGVVPGVPAAMRTSRITILSQHDPKRWSPSKAPLAQESSCGRIILHLSNDLTRKFSSTG